VLQIGEQAGKMSVARLLLAQEMPCAVRFASQLQQAKNLMLDDLVAGSHITDVLADWLLKKEAHISTS
jgi:hypothetical protein